jgi:hypothetical protein
MREPRGDDVQPPTWALREPRYLSEDTRKSVFSFNILPTHDKLVRIII